MPRRIRHRGGGSCDEHAGGVRPLPACPPVRVGLAAIPMCLDDQIIGADNLYSTEPRHWSDEAIAVAAVMADVAASYVVNASKLRQQEQLSEELQEALDSRVVIEQAKGTPPTSAHSP